MLLIINTSSIWQRSNVLFACLFRKRVNKSHTHWQIMQKTFIKNQAACLIDDRKQVVYAGSRKSSPLTWCSGRWFTRVHQSPGSVFVVLSLLHWRVARYMEDFHQVGSCVVVRQSLKMLGLYTDNRSQMLLYVVYTKWTKRNSKLSWPIMSLWTKT